MSRRNGIFHSLFSLMSLIVSKLRSIDNLMVKSDEENLDNALRKLDARMEFNKKVDEALNQSSPKEMSLNGRQVTISV